MPEDQPTQKQELIKAKFDSESNDHRNRHGGFEYDAQDLLIVLAIQMGARVNPEGTRIPKETIIPVGVIR